MPVLHRKDAMIKIDLTEIASHKTPIFAENTRKNDCNTPYLPRFWLVLLERACTIATTGTGGRAGIYRR